MALVEVYLTMIIHRLSISTSSLLRLQSRSAIIDVSLFRPAERSGVWAFRILIKFGGHGRPADLEHLRLARRKLRRRNVRAKDNSTFGGHHRGLCHRPGSVWPGRWRSTHRQP